MTEDQKALNVTADERVRAMRARVSAAKARVEAALEYVMFPEVRQELKSARSDLAAALAYIGK